MTVTSDRGSLVGGGVRSRLASLLFTTLIGAAVCAWAFRMFLHADGGAQTALGLFLTLSVSGWALLRHWNTANTEAQFADERDAKALLAAAPGAIFGLERDGRIISANSAAANLLGLSQGELIGNNIAALVDSPEGDDWWPDAIAHGLEQRSTTMVSWQRDNEPLHSGTLTMSCVASRKGLVAILRDVTELRDAEARFVAANSFVDSIIENIPDMIFVKDAKTLAFVRFNRAGEELIGVSRDQMIGKTDYDFFPTEEAAFFQSKDREVLAAKALVEISTEPIQTMDRGVRLLRTKKIPILDATGHPQYLLGISEDVTELRRIEQVKDEFLAVASHELRTPLTSIQGALALLASERLGEIPAQAKRMLEVAIEGTDRLVRLSDDMLDLERLEAGATIQRAAMCASNAVRETEHLMQPLAESAGIELRVEVAPIPMFADSSRIVQTLTNLVSNAIKFSERGGRVDLAVCEKDGEVQFRVQDYGRGIPASMLDGVFERFTQVDAGDARRRGGAGLGLAICRSIVAQHGGAIWAESKLGVGTTFFFTIPTRTEDAVPSGHDLAPLSG